MKYLYRVRSQRDALCVFPGYKWGNGDQKSCHQKPNAKVTILYLSAHFPSSLPAGLPPPALWRLSQGQYLSKTNPKTWKKTSHSKGFIIEALQEGSISLQQSFLEESLSCAQEISMQTDDGQKSRHQAKFLAQLTSPHSLVLQHHPVEYEADVLGWGRSPRPLFPQQVQDLCG